MSFIRCTPTKIYKLIFAVFTFNFILANRTELKLIYRAFIRKFQKNYHGGMVHKNLEDIVDNWVGIGDPALRISVYSAYFEPHLEILTESDRNLYFYRTNDSFTCNSQNETCLGVIKTLMIFLTDHEFLRTFNCTFRYSDKTVRTFPAYALYAGTQNFKRNFTTYLVICPIKFEPKERIKYPKHVGLTNDKIKGMQEVEHYIKIRYPSPTVTEKDEMAVCVPSLMDNFPNALRIVEFVELQKLLGATKFYFYNQSITHDVDDVLSNYEYIENVQVFPWGLKGYEDEEYEYGGIAACVYDCYFQATIVDKYKYVILLDIDEFIMPIVNRIAGPLNLLDFLHSIDNDSISSFNFRNTYMLNDSEWSDSNDCNHLSNRANKFLYTQCYKFGSQPLVHRFRSKNINKAGKAVILRNHYTPRSLKGTKEYLVSETQALSFHYREYKFDQKWAELVVPPYRKHFTFAIKNGQLLAERVDKVCRQVFKNGTCPRVVISLHTEKMHI